MPDVNLIHDTQQPEEPKPPVRPDPRFELTDPSKDAPRGVGGLWRSLFGARKPIPAPTPAKPADPGRMSVGRAGAQERILSETKSTSRPPVIPLPDEDDSTGVNLLTDELVTKFNPRQKIIQLAMFSLGAVILVAAAYFGLQYYSSRVEHDVTTTQANLTSVREQIAVLGPENTLATSTANKLAALKALIERHYRWTRFFERLEHYTLPSVTYGSTFSGDVSGSMTLSASASSYDEVAKQYLILDQAVLNHDFISKFEITSATTVAGQSGESVSFSINLTILPSVLANTPSSSPS